MHTHRSLLLAVRSAIVLGSFGSLPSLHAQVLTGFDTANGYTSNATVVGVNDTGVPGFASWTSGLSNAAIASSANPLAGDLALRIQRTAVTSGASGVTLDLSGAGVSFTTTPVTLGFGMAVSNYSAGTGNQVQVLLGNNTINPGGAKYWTSLVFSDGALYVYRANTASTNVGVNLGAYNTFSDLGGYIDFSITFDPVAKTYSSVTVTGSKSSLDLTSAFAGVALPWISGTAGDPGLQLTLVAGSNDVVTVDFDNLRLANIPEPSAFAVCAGFASLAAAASSRRRPRVAKGV